MNNLNKKPNKFCGIFIFILIIFLLFSFFVLIAVIKSCSTPPSEYINNRWGISLPVGKLEYRIKGEIGFRGNGIDLYIYKLENDPLNFIENFSTERDTEFENAVNDCIDYFNSLENHEIPNNYLIDFTKKYYWKHLQKNYIEGLGYDDNIYMMYFEDIKLLYLCENLG